MSEKKNSHGGNSLINSFVKFVSSSIDLIYREPFTKMYFNRTFTINSTGLIDIDGYQGLTLTLLVDKLAGLVIIKSH